MVSEEHGNPYWNQQTDRSRIVIFGDCNLQGYQDIGGGVAANLAYDMQYPVYNAGRFLPFDHINPVTEAFLKDMQEKDIVIYVAFSSASFVRSTIIPLRNLGKYFSWSTIDLE